MFGVGVTEFLFILAIAMIVLGPDRLPEAMGRVGRMVRKLRGWANEFRAEFDEEIQMLRSEVAVLQREAELTRQELVEIHAEVAATVGEAQGDLDAAAADIAEQVGSATTTAGGQLEAAAQTLTNPARVAMPIRATPPQAPSPDIAASSPETSAGDAMAGAIAEAFAPANGSGEPADASVPDAPRWRAQPSPGEQLAGASRTISRFSPESGQYATMLRTVAGAGADSLTAGRAALRALGQSDAAELTAYIDKGPMAAALLWAGSMQAHLDAGAISIERQDEASDAAVHIRLTADPFGLIHPIDAPAARLATHYEQAFFAGLGVTMESCSLLSEGAEFTEFTLTRTQAENAAPESG